MIYTFTGSRDFTGEPLVRATLDRLHAAADGGPFRVRVGDCPSGLDRMVRSWCLGNLPRRCWREFHSDWALYGRAAGPMRNMAMVVAEPTADRLLAFWGATDLNRGTRNCVASAMAIGLPVEHVTPDPDPEATERAARRIRARLNPAF